MSQLSKLPARPSLDSLRKQAKKLARDSAAGDPHAIARAQVQLPQAEPPLSQRDAQLVLAREYGFQGWQDLLKEVKHRLGRGLEWALSEARRRIHDNDTEGLRQLLREYPALLQNGGLLAMATDSFGDSGDSSAEEHFTRFECAEILLDAGAAVTPEVCDGLVYSRARKLIDLFRSRGLLPRTLKFLAALGDTDGVAKSLDTNTDGLAAVNEAFVFACHFGQEMTAALLLDRSILLDSDLGMQVDGGPGRSAFTEYFIKNRQVDAVRDPESFRPWRTYVEQQVLHPIGEGDLPAFVDHLRRESWLLSDVHLPFQVRLIEHTAATLEDRSAFLEAFLKLDPAVLLHPPAPARSFIHAFTYARAGRLLPLLLRIWPLPDDLPHAAGSGDLARVKRWFDAAGQPVLGDLANHFPANDAWIRDNLQWGEPSVQQVLDTALAWAVMNNHFDVAGFLLEHGADVNTNWSSHEPASILHELVWHKNYEAMQFLIDHGISMNIHDYRWNATAVGWAAVAAGDEEMAQWMHDAQQRRDRGAGGGG